jgi:RimJ/RimL family protein N-acetyltransferase
MSEPIYAFRPLIRRDAEAIVTWRYEAPYDVYDLDEDAVSSLLRPDCQYYSVRRDDELIGYRCYGSDAQVSGGDYSVPALDTGGGLRPDLTGRGLGGSVLRAAMHFARRHFQVDRFRVTVASFNDRAIRVCTNAGFDRSSEFERPSDHRRFTILMRQEWE